MENSKQTIEQRVKKVISNELQVDLDKVLNNSTLIDDLGADSLDVVSVIVEIEKEFDISITDEEIEDLKTVQHHIDIVEKLYVEEIEVNLSNENTEGRV